jgi:hypothetical protein
VLEVTPPEVLRFFFMRYPPEKQIEFDATEGMLDLVDTYDQTIEEYAETGTSDEIKDIERVLELSQPSGHLPEHPGQTVAMRHLARLVTIYEDTDEVLASVRRSGHVEELIDDEEALLRARIEHTRAWLERFAPDDARLELPEATPPADLLYALDEFRKSAISLLDEEPVQLASRAHELSAWLQGAPNVNDNAHRAPEEITVYAVWRALAETTETEIDTPDPNRLPGAIDELPATLAEADSHHRQGKAQVLVPLLVDVVRRAEEGVDVDPPQLASTVEDWIEQTGAGRPPELPDEDALVTLIEEVDDAVRSLPAPETTPSRDLVASRVRELAKSLDTTRLANLGWTPPDLELADLLVARQLLERARHGLKTLGEQFAEVDWTADQLQNSVYETSDRTGIGTGDVFSLAYLTVLGTRRGPRLGPFIAGLDRDWVTTRLDLIVDA